MSKYSPSRGGHAPGHLREAFADWALAGSSSRMVVVGFDEQEKSAEWLLGQLWNCTDIMPSDLCSALDMPTGSTYGRAARRLK